jgi:hypothetical protein
LKIKFLRVRVEKMTEVGEDNVFVCEGEMKGHESCMFEDSGVMLVV